MKSLLFQPGTTPFIEPNGCGALPCRNEVRINLEREGRLYQFVLRDRVVPEDSYIMMVRAIAFAIQTNEPYTGRAPERSVKDFLVKNNVVV